MIDWDAVRKKFGIENFYKVRPNVDEERLYSTTDARVWAEEFGKVRPDIDQGLMICWFANAIETGRDAGHRAATADPTSHPSPAQIAVDAVHRAANGPVPKHVTDWLNAQLAAEPTGGNDGTSSSEEGEAEGV
jgi:hypothetical protein